MSKLVKTRKARAMVHKVEKELVQTIEKFLDENEELEFDDSVNISFSDEEMRMIVKRDGKYLLSTLDNKTGSSSFEYENKRFRKNLCKSAGALFVVMIKDVLSYIWFTKLKKLTAWFFSTGESMIFHPARQSRPGPP
jgi:predicted PilT family ATPase